MNIIGSVVSLQIYVRQADYAFYNVLVDILMPDVLRPVPSMFHVDHRTSLPPPVSPFSALDLNHISSHFLIPLSDYFSHLYSACTITHHFVHYNRYFVFLLIQFCYNILFIFVMLHPSFQYSDAVDWAT